MKYWNHFFLLISGDILSCQDCTVGCAWLWEVPLQRCVKFFSAVQDIVWFTCKPSIFSHLKAYASSITIYSCRT